MPDSYPGARAPFRLMHPETWRMPESMAEAVATWHAMKPMLLVDTPSPLNADARELLNDMLSCLDVAQAALDLSETLRALYGHLEAREGQSLAIGAIRTAAESAALIAQAAMIRDEVKRRQNLAELWEEGLIDVPARDTEAAP